MLNNLIPSEKIFYSQYLSAFYSESMEQYAAVIGKMEGCADKSAIILFLLSLSYFEWFDIADMEGISRGQSTRIGKALHYAIAAKKKDPELGLSYAQHASIIGRRLTFLQRPFLPVIGARMNALIERSFALQGEHYFCYLQRGISNYFCPALFGGGAENALIDLENSVRLFPENPEAYAWMGLCYEKLRDYERCVQSLERAVSMKTRNRFAERELARIKNRQLSGKHLDQRPRAQKQVKEDCV